jgi:hypothetical protein
MFELKHRSGCLVLQVLSIPLPFPFQFKISLGWLLSALLLAKLFGVYPICSALNLIVSIESAKSINYQHYFKKITNFAVKQITKEFLFLKTLPKTCTSST